MVRVNNSPTGCFWNCVGMAIAVLSVGLSCSLARAKTFELELAQYKLKTGSAILEVQKVSNTLEESADLLPLATAKRQEIKQQLNQTNAALDQASSEIEQITTESIESLPEP
jgi:hypothetical protein